MAYRNLTFEKWEGLGNDFIIVELPERALPFDAAKTQRLCDRHRGIGADGILYVDYNQRYPTMIVANADGSRAQMCGNGLRCVAAYLARQREGNPSVVTLVVNTNAGEKQCVVETAGLAYAVTVDMGVARQAEPLCMPIAGNSHAFTMIDIGNPHAITFEPAYTQADVDAIGPLVSTSFPGGTNVEFCRIDTSGRRPRIDVTVWERGVGRTLACGTGACAVAAAACDAHAIAFDQVVDVALPGGVLEITVASNREVRMRGPARCVFRGEVLSQ